MYTLAC